MSDSLWSEYQAAVQQAIGQQDWFLLGTLYYEMARIVDDEGKDGDYLRTKGKEAKRAFYSRELLNYKTSGVVRKIETMANTAAGACSVCTKANGRVVSLTVALNNSPLPVDGCTHELGCRCTILPAFD